MTSANGSLSTKLTWSAPGATGCTASGHTSWSGAKAASGTVDLPAIALSGTYTLSLACAFPGDNKATLVWVAPTTNTDGTLLTNLAKYKVYRSNNQANLFAQAGSDVALPATTYVYNNLPVGTYYFSVKAVNSDGVESAGSNIASKVIGSATSETQTVTLTVNPVPATPGDLAVT